MLALMAVVFAKINGDDTDATPVNHLLTKIERTRNSLPERMPWPARAGRSYDRSVEATGSADPYLHLAGLGLQQWAKTLIQWCSKAI